MHTAIHWRLQEGFKTRKDNCLFVFSHQIYQTTPTFPLCLLLLRTKPTTTMWFGWGSERKGAEEKVCLAHQPPLLEGWHRQPYYFHPHDCVAYLWSTHAVGYLLLASSSWTKKKILTGDDWWRNERLVDFVKQILASRSVGLGHPGKLSPIKFVFCSKLFKRGGNICRLAICRLAISGPARQWWGRF